MNAKPKRKKKHFYTHILEQKLYSHCVKEFTCENSITSMDCVCWYSTASFCQRFAFKTLVCLGVHVCVRICICENISVVNGNGMQRHPVAGDDTCICFYGAVKLNM